MPLSLSVVMIKEKKAPAKTFPATTIKIFNGTEQPPADLFEFLYENGIHPAPPSNTCLH